MNISISLIFPIVYHWGFMVALQNDLPSAFEPRLRSLVSGRYGVLWLPSRMTYLVITSL